MNCTVTIAGKSFNLTSSEDSDIDVDGVHHQINIRRDQELIELILDNVRYKVFIKERIESSFEIWINNYVLDANVEDHRVSFLRKFPSRGSEASQISTIKAPMPGLVTAIEVAVGDEIECGTGLIILEAMKMENEIRAATDGRVRSIEVQRNTTVEKGQTLLIIEPISSNE